MSGSRPTAASPTPPLAELALPAPAPGGAAQPLVAVAVSGGRDSMALLHAVCTQVAAQANAASTPIAALHVHHGLMPEADAWADLVQTTCAQWQQALGVTLTAQVHRNTLPPPAGESVEAWARRMRYRALAAMAAELGTAQVLLAHHQQDQAETVLLQALRGHALPGLAAMQVATQALGVTWLRPWLAQPAAAIAAYVQQHRVPHVQDASNHAPRFDRSRLRSQVWPALAGAFPQAATQLAQCASRAASAQALVAEVAAADAAACTDAAWADTASTDTAGDTRPVGATSTLALARWAALSPARRWHALAHWLGVGGVGSASAAQVDALAAALHPRAQGRWQVGARWVAAYRGQLHWLARHQPQAPASPSVAGAGAGTPQRWQAHAPGRYPLPAWGGTLVVHVASREGLAPALLQAGVALAARSGGERFALAPQGTPRSLKKQYQARGVPAWQRSGPLLLAADGSVLFAPGMGVDARHWAPVGAPQWRLAWEAPDVPVAQSSVS